MRRRLHHSKRFSAPMHIRKMAEFASQMVSLGNQSGEGWLLTGEMMELVESGVNNIVCVQPFACLPNHITGRGMMKALKARYPTSNITAIDYDPGVSEVNQLNRLKLMMSVAHNNLERGDGEDVPGGQVRHKTWHNAPAAGIEAADMVFWPIG
jgi:predicted nucleotide-binding protein (sugar kinase/HSP70/actin superfamily)